MIKLRSATTTVAAALCAVALAGCGSTENPPAESSAPVEHGAFAHCLEEHGVSESSASPVGPPADVDQAVWAEAMRACASVAPGPAATP